MVEPTSSDWGDAGLVSLLRSPFLIPSVLFHTMLFLLALARRNLAGRQDRGHADFGAVTGNSRWRIFKQEHRCGEWSRRAAYHAKARYTDATDPTKRQIGQRFQRNFSSEQQPG